MSRHWPPPPTGSTPAFKLQLQWLLLIRVIVLTLLLGVSVLLQYREGKLLFPSFRYLAYFIAALYLFTIASSLCLNRLKSYNKFAFLQIISDTLLASFVVYFTGGSNSIFTLLYFLPIIGGGFILFLTGGLLLAAISTFNYGAILLLEYFSYFPAANLLLAKHRLATLNLLLHNFSIYGITFFLVGVLSALLAIRLQKTEETLTRTVLNLDRLNLLYKQIFDDITSGIITVDNNGRITSFNRAAEEITGFSAIEIIGRPIEQQFPAFHEPANEQPRPVTNLTRQDGSSIPVGYSWARLNMPVCSDACRVYTLQDLSKIKAMEEQVRQAEKMATLGEMAANIAHEFRNPLAAIFGAAQILYQETEPTPTNQSLMAIIQRECERMEKNIVDFLRFSKPAGLEQEWISLENLLGEAITLFTQGCGRDRNCEVTIQLPPHLDCWADPYQLRQVILNLLANSCLAFEGRPGAITIAAQVEPGPGGEERLVLTIGDNGPGIPEKILANIFQPFVTGRDNGTGLGLAIVKQIVDAHGGEILINNQPGAGVEFRISLPLPPESGSGE